MADLSDVENMLASLIGAAVYPNGTGQASAVGSTVSIYPGWPTASCLQDDLKAGASHITIFPLRGAVSTYQVNGLPRVMTPPVRGISSTISGSAITFSGAPSSGEVVTLILRRNKTYARGGATLAALLAALLADVQVDFPGSTVVGSVLTVAGTGDITVRIGAPATVVFMNHHVIQPFQVSIWAPTPALRGSLGNLVANTLIDSYRVAMADASHLRCVYVRADELDNKENALLFRRDLVINVDYAITEQVSAFEVTSVTTSWQPYDGVGNGPKPTNTVS